MHSIQVIQRAGALLDAIAGHETSTLKILAAETGLHPSTCFRILASLQEIELVERDRGGSYRLGPKFRQLASRALTNPDLRDFALPVMEGLRDTVGETVNLTVRAGDEIIYVERATPTRMMRVEQIIGSRAPMHITAVGKLMLAEMGISGIREYANRTGLTSYTPNTLTSVERLLDEVEECRRQGYAFDNEEAELGVGCIGVLIRDVKGTALGGLSISCPIERRNENWIALLTKASEEISERIAGNAGAFD